MKPPDVITRYLTSANEGLIDAAHDCFSPDAVVEDEGCTHIGSAAIREWLA